MKSQCIYRLKKIATNALLMLVAGGCSLGPHFEKPKIEVPLQWVEKLESSFQSSPVEWWKHFNDPALNDLLAQAEISNLDIAQALARIRQSRAVVTANQAPLFPWFSVSGDLQRSGNGNEGRSVVVGDIIVGGGSGTTIRNTANVGLSMSWELDVFGAIRRSVEAAQADTVSFQEAYRDTLVILRADVASAYFTMRGLQNRYAVAGENLEAQVRNAAIVKKRHVAGFASVLDLHNAEAQVATTRAILPQLEATIRKQMYAIALLLGKEPGALLDSLQSDCLGLSVPPAVDLGLPSDLLRKRPDIRRAEANVAGATARVGVAVADLFPKFSISALIGSQGTSVGVLNDWQSRVWNVAAGIAQPVFQGGRLMSEVDRQEAVLDESVAAYREVVLTAIKEVEDSLISFKSEGERLAHLEEAVEKNKRALQSAEDLYVSGLAEFLQVLTAQRSLYAAEDALATSRSQRAVNLVQLYRALGGGA